MIFSLVTEKYDNNKCIYIHAYLLHSIPYYHTGDEFCIHLYTDLLQIFQEENTSIELFADLENSGFLRESHSAFFNAGDPITTLKFYRST